MVEGDITGQDVDAVVNAANNRMRGGGGVDGAIHRAGGPAVLADCVARFPHGLATGEAGWTTAGQLAATWVIHVVGPNFSSGQRDRSLLTSCYSRALAVADELGARTVAFPLVSAGVYGWPLDDAVAAAVSTLRSTPTRVGEARLVAFGSSTFGLIAAALRDSPSRNAAETGATSGIASGTTPPKPVFVLHEHHRPSHHFDLRLEEDGVLRSWAVPRGMPPDPRHDRLAVQVGDHDLEHATYTDEHKDIADTGWWELEDRTERRFVFVLHGRAGPRRYALITTDPAGRNRLLHLTKDQPASGTFPVPTPHRWSTT